MSDRSVHVVATVFKYLAVAFATVVLTAAGLIYLVHLGDEQYVNHLRLRDSMVLLAASNHLKPGMSRAEVRNIMGSPDNTDDRYVWMYIIDPEFSLPQREPFKDIYLATSTFYLLFDDDGRLLGGMCKGAAGNPWEDYAGGVVSKSVEERLGPLPEILRFHGEAGE